jgi:hypothetical protein
MLGSAMAARKRASASAGVAEAFEQAAVVEPLDPLEGSGLHVVDVAPRPGTADHLGLEQADHRPGERIIEAVADTTDRRLYFLVSQSLSVPYRQVLAPAVRVVNGTAIFERRPLMDRLLESIEDERRVRRRRGAPADNLARESVADEG